ncbi:MAG: phosphoribosylamine--glycine ligase [Verrucomicrobia bacterium]|nr:phosphoribosylamine--glycine ligase [Verrucomicrobiota bacterium]
MKVLVVGGGGREHALAWKLSRSPRVSSIYVAPGNAGTQTLAKNVPLQPTDLEGLLRFAETEQVDFTVVGPDDPLAFGIVDRFRAAGKRIFGPTQSAARLESSKSFAKEFMQRHGIPTARFASFDSPEAALAGMDQFGFPVVVKADGLALGKGVLIAPDRASAARAIRDLMVDKRFGEAGHRIVLEEYLKGDECSMHALVDGSNYLLFPPAQDHKALYDGNRGPNTGGMGAFSPTSRLTPQELVEIEQQVLVPFLAGIKEEGIEFTGLLFPGLMLTKAGPRVLEFNCRFGDPETQVLLPRLQSDLLELLEATLTGSLHQFHPVWDEQACVCVVVASGGYPDRYQTGKPIIGLESATKLPQVTVFHAGTRLEDGRVVTSGGRVLGVAALGASLLSAKRRAYDVVNLIEFDGHYFRRDIGG